MRTKNYRKLALVGMILINNTLNEIGIKLGVRPRNRNTREKIYEYMRMINEVFLKNLNIQIFSDKLLSSLQESEQLFLKTRGDMPLEYVRRVFADYFEVVKIEIPNLHEKLQFEDLSMTTPGNLFSFISSIGQKRRRNDNILQPLLLQKIQQQEMQLQKEVTLGFDSQKFETSIHLKHMKDTLIDHKSKKITVEGTLKDNISYQRSQIYLFSYFIFGIGLLFFLFGMLMLLQMILQPNTVSIFGVLVLSCFVPCIVLYILYKKSNKNGDS